MSDYERAMLATNREAWSTPAILPLSVWLSETWQSATLTNRVPSLRLLSSDQEAQIWKTIVEADNNGLLRVEATAQKVQKSLRLCREWQLDFTAASFGDTRNSQAFKKWAGQFELLCKSRGYASESDISSYLIGLFAGGDFKLPEMVFCTGFYELTPLQINLLSAMQKAGCQVSWVEIQTQQGQVQRLKADDARHEAKLLASWARQLLAESPAVRIGIVVPDLDAQRVQLSLILDQALDPPSLQPGSLATSKPFNFSLGKKLTDYPLIRVAFYLLSLMKTPASVEVLGTLLSSPYWAMPRDACEQVAEQSCRALLDKKLRSNGDTQVSISTVCYYAGQHNAAGEARPWRSRILTAHLEQIIQLAKSLPSSASTAEWAIVFTTWLKAIGWLGARSLDSNEYQTVEAWKKLLSAFNSLNDFSGSVSGSVALSMFKQQAGAMVFQPESSDAAIQVLGLYEAIGQKFDHLWVMDLHDGNWPPASAADPFIPLSLQRSSGMPHTDPDQELKLAELMTSQFCSAAKKIILGYPGVQGNEALACSPLIQKYPVIDSEHIAQWQAPNWQETIRLSGELESVENNYSIKLEASGAFGGSSIFKNQAGCPFRAFAMHRLGAKDLESTEIGLGPMRRGSVLHHVLELFWQVTESHANLLQLDDKHLTMRVAAAVSTAIQEQTNTSRHTMTARYSAIESRCLQEQTLAWLELEKQRVPFTVTGIEQEMNVAVAGVEVHLYIDRVDELADGQKVIIDYKSGKISPSGWFGDRPDDPQLPLYSTVMGEDPIAAVAFGQIRAGEIGFKGVVGAEGILPGLPTNRKGPLKDATENWPAVLGEWSQVINELAGQFKSGVADASPKKGFTTCTSLYCELSSLCRIRESIPPLENDKERGVHDGE